MCPDPCRVPGKPMGDSNEPPKLPAATDADLVEYLMIVVPELDSLHSLTDVLGDLVESAAIRILDLVCVSRSSSNGRLTVLELEDVKSLAAMQKIEGDVGGLLSQHDIETASVALPTGKSAIILLVEDRWAESLSAAARQAGGLVLGGERIARPRFEAAHATNTTPRQPRRDPGSGT